MPAGASRQWAAYDAGKRRDTAHVLPSNGRLLILDFRVPDAVDLQVLPQQLCGRCLHLERIAQRPERIGELEEKRLPLFAGPQRLAPEAQRRIERPALFEHPVTSEMQDPVPVPLPNAPSGLQQSAATRHDVRLNPARSSLTASARARSPSYAFATRLG